MDVGGKDGSASHKLEKNTKMAGASKNRRSRESLHDSDDLDADPTSPTREEEKTSSAYPQNGSKMRSGSTTAATGNNAKKFLPNQDQAKNVYKQQNSQDRNEGSAAMSKKGQALGSSGTPSNLRGQQQRSPLKGKRWPQEEQDAGQNPVQAQASTTESSSTRDNTGNGSQ
jgi:hypothetical protein